MDWSNTLRYPSLLHSLHGARRKASTKLRFIKKRWFPSTAYLEEVLRTAAKARPPCKVLYYPLGTAQYGKPEEISYTTLYYEACRLSGIVGKLEAFRKGAPVLVHVEDHWDAILWFWAVYLANGIPVISTTFSNVAEHRRNHLNSLAETLGGPVCITRQKYLWFLDDDYGFHVHTIETLLAGDSGSQTPEARPTLERTPAPLGPSSTARPQSSDSMLSSIESMEKSIYPYQRRQKRALTRLGEDIAVLSLTSGSTGVAKAVKLSHRQILAAAMGKASVRQLPKDKPFLNWIGLDHVASLIEIHIQALYLGVDQIHVQAADVISLPDTFLDLLSRHQVSRTFAPNFFLAKLVSWPRGPEAAFRMQEWDFSNLTVLASGGEANDVGVCQDATTLLSRYGASSNVIMPGFGMTETCAGAIFNLDCPSYDQARGLQFATVGRCMEGIQMRITLPTTDGRVALAPQGLEGDVEVRGEVVSAGYYRNRKANAESFTPDGWFKTGDQGLIDDNGHLHLAGRLKDVMNINGIKVSPAEVQRSIEIEVGGLVNRIVSFPSWATGAHTEQITVAYVPKTWPEAPEAMAEINDRTIKACLVCTSSRPLVFPVGHESLIPISALGKVSKTKIRSLFEEGFFDDNVKMHDEAIAVLRESNSTLPLNVEEELLMRDFGQVLGLNTATVGPETPVYDIGFTSMDLIRLKQQIENRVSFDIPVLTLMQNPTARSLAAALQGLGASTSQSPTESAAAAEYDPVVTFRSEGSKAPLWLIHPGVGEVLVFVGLAQHLADDDRPVYALRARGFEPGEPLFDDVDDAVETYLAAIRKRQPKGPYALAGYSYGTMLAFEVAKRLDAECAAKGFEGPPVQFLGSFNLPPHIKSRMQRLNWNLCILHLSFFLGLMTEKYADSIEDGFREVARDEARARIFAVVDKARMEELRLSKEALVHWADVAFGLQGMAVDYEPSGSVLALDVFHAMPLRLAAKSQEDWVENHLGKWRDFCAEEPRFHGVGGAHYTMLSPEYVESFAATLKAALCARGL